MTAQALTKLNPRRR